MVQNKIGRMFNRKITIATARLLAVAILSIAVDVPGRVVDAASPNVIVIIIDDLRDMPGGQWAKTPQLDAFARTATRFDNAYTTVPVCGASRAALLTGMRPTASRFVAYNARADRDAPEADTLPGFFKQNGYATGGYGKVFHDYDDSINDWTLGYYGPNLPLTRWRQYATPAGIAASEQPGSKGLPYEIGVDADGNSLPDSAYHDGMTAARVVDDIRRLTSDPATADHPFFMAVGFVKPHLPFVAPKKYWDLYDRDDIEIIGGQSARRPAGVACVALHDSPELRAFDDTDGPIPYDESRTRLLTHAYLASTSYVDAQVGRVLAGLDELKLYDQTVVAVLSDHGYFLGDHGLWTKHALFEEALRVPMMIRLPGQTTGVESDIPVSTLDIYPTLAAVALPGKRPDQRLDGIDLTDALTNAPSANINANRAIFSRYESGSSVRLGSYRYSRWPPAGTGQRNRQMLFNLRDDPVQTHNLLRQPGPEAIEIAERLSDRLDRWEAAGRDD